MKFGKTIKIFLIDGDPNGRMTCELSNWTGKAYKIPRNKIARTGLIFSILEFIFYLVKIKKIKILYTLEKLNLF